jgi:hypothetical protein
MFDFEPIEPETRNYMIQELDFDIVNNSLYINPFLKKDSETLYLSLLHTALTIGNPESFAAAITANDLLIERHIYTKEGREIEARVPATFNATLAAGEFNRYFMRAVCLTALQQGKPVVEIYRAKAVGKPRQQTDDRLGHRIDPQVLLADLRQTNFENPSVFGLGGPNSGLSIRIPPEG